MTSNILKAWQAILIALLFITGSANFANLLPSSAGDWAVLIVGSLAAGTGYFTASRGTMPADLSQSRGY